MSKTNLPWVTPLGLSTDQLTSLPSDESPLVSALANKAIDEEKYVNWASLHYKLPAIRHEFFSMAVDFSLIEKYSNTSKWSSTLYPIYQWEDVVYIACLEPPVKKIELNCCFVIAPYEAMNSAWKKFHKIDNVVTPTQTIKESTAEFDFSDLKQETAPHSSPIQNSRTEKKETDTHEKNPVADLDFSNMMTDETPESPIEATKTEVATSINNLTTATQTAEMPADESFQEKTEIKTDVNIHPFENLTTGGIALQGEPSKVVDREDKEEKKLEPVANEQISAKEHSPSSLPSLDELKTETEITKTDEISVTDAGRVNFKDDYTPVPLITKAQQEKQMQRKQTASKQENPDLAETTLTDHAHPLAPPMSNQITEKDLQKYKSLENAESLKGVMSHIFGHLKKDYKKIMWIEKQESDLFYPKYVIGNWRILDLAWKMHINLADPNIFRIAHKSALPFHGEISRNPQNDKYFELWTEARPPDFATVYPVLTEKDIIGFICCFGKNLDFDEVRSLKKIENLVSICSRNLKKTSQAA